MFLVRQLVQKNTHSDCRIWCCWTREWLSEPLESASRTKYVLRKLCYLALVSGLTLIHMDSYMDKSCRCPSRFWHLSTWYGQLPTLSCRPVIHAFSLEATLEMKRLHGDHICCWNAAMWNRTLDLRQTTTCFLHYTSTSPIIQHSTTTLHWRFSVSSSRKKTWAPQ